MTAEEYREQVVNPALGVIKFKDKKPKTFKIDTPKEKDLQKAILEALQFIGGFFWRQNSGVFPDKNEVRRIRSGVKGIGDILGVYKGRFISIEVKTEKTKKNVSISQMAFMETVKQNGGVAFVCWDPGTVISQLKEEL